MIKNDRFYTSKGTKRLLDEFRAVAGCRTTEQAVEAVFSIAAAMTADHLAGLKYCAKEDGGPAWNIADAIKTHLSSPTFCDLIKQKEICEIPMSSYTHFQLGHLTAQADKAGGPDVTFTDAFTLAVLMAKDVHDKFGNGQLVNIPVDMKKGSPLYERHIHMAP